MSDVLLKALNSDNPSPRYYITKVTWIAGILMRILPTRRVDKILRRMNG